MRIAIIGSREGFDQEFIDLVLKANIKKEDIIITGAARGVDSFVANYCKKNNIACIFINPADLSRRQDYLIRNKIIVDSAEKIIAFWNQTSKGTDFVIAHAKDKGKECQVYLNNQVDQNGTQGTQL